MLEWLFWAGHVTTNTRRNSFERIYDLPERVLLAEIVGLPTSDADAFRELVLRSAQEIGIGTATDLCGYFRLGVVDARVAIDRLVDGGALLPVRVGGRSSRRKSILLRDVPGGSTSRRFSRRSTL